MADSPEHTATSEAAGHSGGGGLPQFEFQYWGGQIVWLLLIFAVLYTLLAKVFVPRLRGVIEGRETAIATAISRARQVQSEAESQSEAAQRELAEARATAQKTASDAKTAANAESAARRAAEDAALDAKMAEAELRIKASRDSAMASVSDLAKETSAAIIEKLTGTAASPDEMSAAFAELKTAGAA
jgi:F-type H+-transporting ATPase subunit b